LGGQQVLALTGEEFEAFLALLVLLDREEIDRPERGQPLARRGEVGVGRRRLEAFGRRLRRPALRIHPVLGAQPLEGPLQLGLGLELPNLDLVEEFGELGLLVAARAHHVVSGLDLLLEREESSLERAHALALLGLRIAEARESRRETADL